MENRPYSCWFLEHIGNHEIFRLFIGANSIGRHTSNTLRFRYDFLSRQHAIISVREDDVTISIKCLNSLNGVFVNGRRLNGAVMQLHDRDQIRIGVSEMPKVISARDTIFILHKSRLNPNELIELSDDEDVVTRLPEDRNDKPPASPDGSTTSEKEMKLITNSNSPASSDGPSSSNKAMELIENITSPNSPDRPTTSKKAMELMKSITRPDSPDRPTTSKKAMELMKSITRPDSPDRPTTSKKAMELIKNSATGNQSLLDANTKSRGALNETDNSSDVPIFSINVVESKNKYENHSSLDEPTTSIPLQHKLQKPPSPDVATSTLDEVVLENKPLKRSSTEISTATQDKVIIKNKPHSTDVFTITQDEVVLKNKPPRPPSVDVFTQNEVLSKNKIQLPLSPVGRTSSGDDKEGLKSKLHMPLLPNIKIEGVHNAVAEIKDLFGEPDEVILDNMKSINGYVFNQICNGSDIAKHLSNDEALLSGDIIDICGDADETDKTCIRNSKSNKNQNYVKDDDGIINLMSDDEENDFDDEGEEFLLSQIINEDLKKDCADSDSDFDISVFEEQNDNILSKKPFLFHERLLEKIKVEWSDQDSDSDSIMSVYKEQNDDILLKTPFLFHERFLEKIKEEWSDQDPKASNTIKTKPNGVTGSPNKISKRRHSEIPSTSKQLEIAKATESITKAAEVPLKGNHKTNMPQRTETSDSSSPILKRRHSIHSSCFENEPPTKKINNISSMLNKVKVPGNHENYVFKTTLDKDCRLSDKPKTNEKSNTPSRILKRRHSVHTSKFEDESAAMNLMTSSLSAISKKRDSIEYSYKEDEATENQPTNTTNAIKRISCRRQSVSERNMVQIISPPSLPKHKGKLRGVSAVSVADRIRKEIRNENYIADLNKKWHTKAIHKKKEDDSIIKHRKDRLKKIAEDAQKNKELEKIVETDRKEKNTPVSAKVTTVNRAALLANELKQQLDKNISKVNERPESTVSRLSRKQRSISVDSRSNQEYAEAPQEQLEERPQRGIRVLNKLTFAKMESAFEKQQSIDQRVKKMKKMQVLETSKTSESIPKPKKKVCFNDTPIIHIIESRSCAYRKVERLKDSTAVIASTYQSRRDAMLRKYIFVDQKPSIILDILGWSNQWLKLKDEDKETDAHDTILPMPNAFLSFEHYKSVLFPLMKLEFQKSVEDKYKQKTKPFNVSLENVYKDAGHFKLITKGKSSDITKFNLNTITFETPSKLETFAYLASARKGSELSTLEFCIEDKNFTENILLSQKTLTVRPIVDNIRVEFGAFNSVHHLKNTPLFKKIINPLHLNSHEESKSDSIKRIKNPSYEGYNTFNPGQLKALMDTYLKVINDSEPNITLIHGPPGTGKSLLIANLAIQCLLGAEVRFRDRKILICSHSNAAINNITLRFKTINEKQPEHKKIRVIRFGNKDMMCAMTEQLSLEHFLNEIKQEKIKNSLSPEQSAHFATQKSLLKEEIKQIKLGAYKGTYLEDKIAEKEKELQYIKYELNKHFTLEMEFEAIKEILEEADVVCTTLTSCVKLSQYIKYFDICIIDEATQATEPLSLIPLQFCIPSLVLVGDTQQLPATVLSKKASEMGLKTSMFARIQKNLEQKGASATDGIIHRLTTQYRMHPEIAKWPNEYFYKKSLYDDINTLKQTTDILPYCIFDLKYAKNETCSKGKVTNKMEAEFIAKLLSLLVGHIPIKTHSYVVLSTYAMQIDTIKNEMRRHNLPHISANTIDAYQGLQRDVVVVSNTRSCGVGFLSNYQRLNVALTRARECLILCGNFRDLERVPVWKYLLKDARVRNLYFPIEKPYSRNDMRTILLPKILAKKP